MLLIACSWLGAWSTAAPQFTEAVAIGKIQRNE
jgi:hypothetical protein